MTSHSGAPRPPAADRVLWRVASLFLSAWLIGSLLLFGYQLFDTVRVVSRHWGETEEEARARRHGKRWDFYRALAELPPASEILLLNEGDDLYHYASYYAYPRLIRRREGGREDEGPGTAMVAGPGAVSGDSPDFAAGSTAKRFRYRARFDEEKETFIILPLDGRPPGALRGENAPEMEPAGEVPRDTLLSGEEGG